MSLFPFTKYIVTVVEVSLYGNGPIPTLRMLIKNISKHAGRIYDEGCLNYLIKSQLFNQYQVISLS